MAKKSNSMLWKLGGLLLIGVVAWMQARESSSVSKVDQAEEVAPQAQGSVPRGSKKFQTLDRCELIAHRHNDGDSFHVQCAMGDVEFRLYYVDAPESAAKTYRNGDNNYKRLAQQGRAMGGLTQKQTTAIGKDAKFFVKELLGNKPFRVITRWENVYGPERRYALVVVRWNGQERYLHEILVEKGMARIHTKPVKLPDGRSISSQMRHLHKLEKVAKQQGKGAWGMK